MPVETDTLRYSQAQAEKRTLKTEFGHNPADVIHAYISGYCGMGNSFVGHYRRKTAQQ